MSGRKTGEIVGEGDGSRQKKSANWVNEESSIEMEADRKRRLNEDFFRGNEKNFSA